MVNITFTIVLQWLNFAILLFLLGKLLFKPLTNFLDKRRRDIQDAYDDAQKAKEEADKVLEAHQEKMDGADQEAMEIKFKARNEGLKEREKIIDRAESEATKVLTKAQEEILLQEKKALRRLREETVDLSVAVARRLLEKEIDKEDQRRFINQSIKELEVADG